MNNLGPGEIVRLPDPVAFEVSIALLRFSKDGRTKREVVHLQRVNYLDTASLIAFLNPKQEA